MTKDQRLKSGKAEIDDLFCDSCRSETEEGCICHYLNHDDGEGSKGATVKLIQHLATMADDDYLSGHQEWVGILRDAYAVMAEVNEEDNGPNAMPTAEMQRLESVKGFKI